jgi:hypothetical protein
MEVYNPYLADGKGFNSRTSRQESLKSARFATKMLPKRVLPICYQTDSGRGLTAGDQPFMFSHFILVDNYDSKTKPFLPVDGK